MLSPKGAPAMVGKSVRISMRMCSSQCSVLTGPSTIYLLSAVHGKKGRGPRIGSASFEYAAVKHLLPS
jgi:hypothetical protein